MHARYLRFRAIRPFASLTLSSQGRGACPCSAWPLGAGWLSTGRTVSSAGGSGGSVEDEDIPLSTGFPGSGTVVGTVGFACENWANGCILLESDSTSPGVIKEQADAQGPAARIKVLGQNHPTTGGALPQDSADSAPYPHPRHENGNGDAVVAIEIKSPSSIHTRKSGLDGELDRELHSEDELASEPKDQPTKQKRGSGLGGPSSGFSRLMR